MFRKKLCMMLLVVILLSYNTVVFAHEEILNVDYDKCIVPTNDSGEINEEDGEGETWYCLTYNFGIGTPHNDSDDILWQFHLDEEVHTVKYYFEDSFTDKTGVTYSWTTDLSLELIQEIKEAYANSMKKWNNVYYYSYDENGRKITHKVINIIEGTDAESSDLIIYPIDTEMCKREYNGKNYIATTSPTSTKIPIQPELTEIEHYHYDKWKMLINVDYFYAHSSEGSIDSPEYLPLVSSSYASINKERNGQHEFGHVLGLKDVDTYCDADTNVPHHEEVLMGYGNGNRSTYAKYKDIAGVSITRGFHTDADHKWMIRTIVISL